MKRLILVGPYRTARRYAERRSWSEDDYLIITRAHQLAELDPALIASIIMIQLHALGKRIMAEIYDEIARVRVFWPVPTVVAQ